MVQNNSLSRMLRFYLWPLASSLRLFFKPERVLRTPSCFQLKQVVLGQKECFAPLQPISIYNTAYTYINTTAYIHIYFMVRSTLSDFELDLELGREFWAPVRFNVAGCKSDIMRGVSPLNRSPFKNLFRVQLDIILKI